ncbi:Hypothetical predicted protein [Octopus vulgaris]|uniref:Uncharacterized protein n=1 Tax=Octopus vulgaris TaxID=6645 RepID=A0AA36AXY9_OCTVU|nr:Hypothetical predicted protein [Octopus vulgaris]
MTLGYDSRSMMQMVVEMYYMHYRTMKPRYTPLRSFSKSFENAMSGPEFVPISESKRLLETKKCDDACRMSVQIFLRPRISRLSNDHCNSGGNWVSEDKHV